MFLCDSNILIYAYDSKSPFHEEAKSFLEEKSEIKGEVCLAPQVILELFGIITQKAKKPLKISTALQIIKEIKENENLLFISPLSVTYFKALELAEKYEIKGRDIFDLYLVATMIDNGINQLATHNIKDFEKFSEISVFDPVE